MENKPKKSKALIITIIALILLLIAGYLIFKNRDAFGVKTSASIARIFSPLVSSTNSKNLTTVQAGEDIKKGDNVSVFGTGTNNIPIIMKTTGSNSVFGSAYEDINSGNTGQITPNTKSNSFFNSFAKFLGGIFNKKNQGGISTTPPAGGWAMDSNTGKWNFDPNGTGGWVFDSTLDKWTPPSNICSLPRITDTDTSECIDPSQCILPKIIVGDKCENPSIGGAPDLVAGIVTPTGTTIFTVTDPLPTGGDLAPGDTTPPGGGITPPAIPATPPNICLDIEQNPLTFTPEEKARLEVLLRKFYLISSTLRTSEDITTIYNEIDQQNNFIGQIKDLTNQCNVQVTPAMMTTNNWVRHGNPLFIKNSGGTFPYTSDNTGYTDLSWIQGPDGPGCKVVSGFYYGKLNKEVSTISGSETKLAWWTISDNTTTTVLGREGDDCSIFNNGPNGFSGYNSCTWGDVALKIRNQDGQPDDYLLNAGCKWQDGVDLGSTERVLNIW